MGNKLYGLIKTTKQMINNYIIKYNLKEKLAKNLNKALKLSKKSLKKVKTEGLSKKQTIIIAAVLIISIIVLLIPTQKQANPISVLENISYKIKQGDTKTIKQNIAVDKIANELATTIAAEIKSDNLSDDLMAYIKNELQKNIENDFYSIIASHGDFRQNINNKNAVLSKFINYLLNNNGKIIKTDVTDSTNNKATLNITIFRPDINQETTVNLRLEKINNNWKIIKVLNLKELLKTLENLESKRIELLNKEITKNFSRFIVLKDFQKSELNTKTNSFLIRLSLENISDENIKSLKGSLNLATEKQLIGSININIDEPITANNFYEKAWAIKLNDLKSLENLSKINSENIIPQLNIEEIIFEKGNALKLIN